jgi:short-subunit dehydrogenase
MVVYIVTGSSSGLGFALTKKLLQRGMNVVGVSRAVGECSIFKGSKGFQHIACDLGKDIDLSKFDTITSSNEVILIINAAQFEFESKETLSNERTKELFSINYFSAVALVDYFKTKRLSRVMFVNSIAGKEPQANQFQYSSSKHALQAYSEVLAKDSVGKSFDVMSVNPGGIDTALWEDRKVLEKKITDEFISPEVLSDFLSFMLELPKKTYIKSLAILPEHDI